MCTRPHAAWRAPSSPWARTRASRLACARSGTPRRPPVLAVVWTAKVQASMLLVIGVWAVPDHQTRLRISPGRRQRSQQLLGRPPGAGAACCSSLCMPGWAADLLATGWAVQGHRGSLGRQHGCGRHGLLVEQLHTAALDAVGDVPRRWGRPRRAAEPRRLRRRRGWRGGVSLGADGARLGCGPSEMLCVPALPVYVLAYSSHRSLAACLGGQALLRGGTLPARAALQLGWPGGRARAQQRAAITPGLGGLRSNVGLPRQCSWC